MWVGNLKGQKGFRTYKFETSNSTPGYSPSARYNKNGVFFFVYRRNCALPDKKTIAEGIRNIIGFKSKYLIVVDHKNFASTIEFYCRLDTMPDNNTMEKLENFLNTADFS